MCMDARVEQQAGTDAIGSRRDSADHGPCIPHRYPFLMIERLTEIVPHRKRGSASRTCPMNEPQFQGHFPERPIMPGRADRRGDGAGGGLPGRCIRSKHRQARAQSVYFMSINDARFRKPVFPGDHAAHPRQEAAASPRQCLAFQPARRGSNGVLVAEADLYRHDFRARRNCRDEHAPDSSKCGRRSPVPTLADDVVIGPFCSRRCRTSNWRPRVELVSHVAVAGHHQRSAPRTKRLPFLPRSGTQPQDLKYHGEPYAPGNRRRQPDPRKSVSINTGTEGRRHGVTRIGEPQPVHAGLPCRRMIVRSATTRSSSNQCDRCGGHVTQSADFADPGRAVRRPSTSAGSETHAFIGGVTGVEQ